MLVSFGDYAFDLARQTLTLGGSPVRLEPQVAALLSYLVQHAGELLSRDALKARVWPDGGSDTTLNYTVSRVRRALNQYGGRTITAVRGRGYRFDPELREVIPSASEHESSARTAELGALRLLGSAMAGSPGGRFVLINGGCGMGKTRLVRAFEAEWRTRGDRSTSGHFVAEAPPLWFWQNLLDELANGRGPERMSLHGLPGSSARRFATYVQVRERLETAAASGPLLIVLEDLHLADRFSLGLLQFLATNLRSAPIFYLATCRTPLFGTWEPAVQELSRHAQVVTLGPLGERDARRVIRAALGTCPSPEQEGEALRLGQGNPLFLREIALSLRERGPRGEHERISPLPLAIRDALEWQLSAVDEAGRRILRVAAVIGEQFDAWQIARMLDEGVGTVLSRLTMAIRHDMVRPVTEISFRFTHALIREHVYAKIDEAERRDYHFRIGALLAERDGAGTPEGLRAIARRLAEGALTQAQAREAVAYGRRSAAVSVERRAFDQAAHEYARTLRLADAAALPVSERLDVLSRAADSLRLAIQAEAAERAATERA